MGSDAGGRRGGCIGEVLFEEFEDGNGLSDCDFLTVSVC